MNIDSKPSQDLYELPPCTICLNELSTSLASLKCGHVFHDVCIIRNFGYRGTCPNCQDRASQRDVRPIHFPFQKNTLSAQLMREVLGNLSKQEKEQVQKLFKEVQNLTQKNQKLQNGCKEAQKQAQKAAKQLSDVKTNFNRTSRQLAQLKKDSVELKKVFEHLNSEIKKLESENFDLRQTILDYKEKDADYDQVKKYKKIMHDNAQELINYKHELEKKNTSPVEMAKQFFDMILIKHLDVFNLKNKLQSYPEKLADKEEEIRKLESQLERLKKESKESKEKAAAEKKKYEELKQKYKKLYEKYKEKCQGQSDDQNNEDSMFSRPSFPLAPVVNASRGNTSNSSLIFNFEMNENNEMNIQRRQSENKGSFVVEDEREESRNRGEKKDSVAVQGKLDFFIKKPAQASFVSFGGVKPKKSGQEMKKQGFKNLFG